jgi:hypothetical protein
VEKLMPVNRLDSSGWRTPPGTRSAPERHQRFRRWCRPHQHRIVLVREHGAGAHRVIAAPPDVCKGKMHRGRTAHGCTRCQRSELRGWPLRRCGARPLPV